MENIQINPSLPDEYQAISQMVYDYFKEEKQTDPRIVVTNWNNIIPTVLKRLNEQSRDFLYFSVHKNSKLIGVINILFPANPHTPELGEILIFYIKPEYRDRAGNIYDHIFKWGINILRDLGAKSLKTEILTTDNNQVDVAKKNNLKMLNAFFTLDV